MLRRLRGCVRRLSRQRVRRLIAQLQSSQLIPGGSVSRINLNRFRERFLGILQFIFLFLFESFFESLFGGGWSDRAGYTDAGSVNVRQPMQRDTAPLNTGHETNPAAELYGLRRKACQLSLNLTILQIAARLCAHTIVVHVGTAGIADRGCTLRRIPKAKTETAMRIAIGFAMAASAANGLNRGRLSQFRPIIDDNLARDEDG